MLVTIAIPVKDGAAWLPEVLEAIRKQEVDAEVEVLVCDSGSGDGSVEICRRAGARVIEIPPSDFGHGRTRNLLAEEARGEAIAFLTQDATPAGSAWLGSLIEALHAGERVGMAFGPHLPRPDTSPMIARELTEFFAAKSPAGSVVVSEEDPFFSSVNCIVSRECVEQVRFRDIPYAEDQAFAADAGAAGWRKAYAPGAGVLHAHDYPWLRFMRRYFDEYRGLRSAIGHKERLPGRWAVGHVRRQVRGDLAWLRARGAGTAAMVRWAPRSFAHHAGRAVFAPLGSRWQFFPAFAQRRLSLEGRAGGPPASLGGVVRPPGRGLADAYAPVAERYRRDGAPLRPSPPGDGPWRIGVAVPFWKPGSGGHRALFELMRGLERRGHAVSVGVLDPLRARPDLDDRLARREVDEHFGGVGGDVRMGIGALGGCDIALATGWQTAHALWAVEGLGLRAYLVQDHEPEFYGTSAEAIWAADTYRLGYPCVCSSPWLAELLSTRYGARTEWFRYAVDDRVYGDRRLPRDPDTVIAYVRKSTPRRGTPLVELALTELRRRRPRTRVCVFGQGVAANLPFPYEDLGIARPQELSEAYGRAAAGLVVSLTNHSLVPEEMMACGLPVVDVRGPAEAVWQAGEAVLAEPDPISIAAALARLLDDPRARDRQAEAGRRSVEGRTWDDAAARIEDHLRTFLGERLTAPARRGAGVPAQPGP